jgi:protein SCO1
MAFHGLAVILRQNKGMSKKAWFYIVFFAVLLGGFYFFLFRDYDFSKSKLAVINPSIPEFSFIDQNGMPFTNVNTENKVYVAEYFFTTCKGICPRMNTNMRRVYNAYKDEKDFLIVSHTCMPETDSIPLLKSYEFRMLNDELVKKDDGSYKMIQVSQEETKTVGKTNWYFVTGDKRELYKLARHGYLIDNGKPDTLQNISDQFIHSQLFALVDRYQRVRGIYDGLKETEVDKLITDVKSLLKEKVDHTRFLNGFGNSPN